MEDFTLFNRVTNCASYILLGCLNGELFKTRLTTKKLKFNPRHKVAEENFINPLLIPFKKVNQGKEGRPPASTEENLINDQTFDGYHKLESHHRETLLECLIRKKSCPQQ